jgi:hypothetical protein
MRRLSLRILHAVIGTALILPLFASAAPGYVRLPGHLLSALAGATVVDANNAARGVQSLGKIVCVR